MSKRNREEDEVIEVYAALLRQSGARAVERIRQRRTNNINNYNYNNNINIHNIVPIDALVIQYAMWFLDTRAFPPTSYITQAQRVITEAIERISLPQYYNFISLPTLVEGLVAENTAEVMQQTVSAIEEFIEAREALGRWIEDNSSGIRGDINNNDNDIDDELDDENEIDEIEDTSIELAGILWRSGKYWVAVLEYIEALSLSSAKVNAFALRPKYEQALMQLLNSIAAPRLTGCVQARTTITNNNISSSSSSSLITKTTTNSINSNTTEAYLNGNEIKEEVKYDNNSFMPPPPPISTLSSSSTNTRTQMNKQQQEILELTRANTISKLLADLTALANCPSDNSLIISSGINPIYYAMVHARLNVLAACDRLEQFSKTSVIDPPPLTSAMQSLQEQQLLLMNEGRQQLRKSECENKREEDIGVPLDFVPSETYMRAALEKNNDSLGEDEELFKDEILDYYKRQSQQKQKQQQQQQQQSVLQSSITNPTHNNISTTSGRRGSQTVLQESNKSQVESTTLVKPHRFCKVKTGYTWTQYNRTHYDSRTNPPPRSVLWYEFTLFYPALANTKRDMSRIYRIEETPRGANDDYCILVFSVGPPYADVAYQIVRKQWDPRPGGVRASFDSSGTYRLFFRFTNSNYRR